MKLFALADLHLGHAVDKPMHIFGANWKSHQSRIAQSWCSLVGDDDVVLIPGDISWAMTLDEARPDLNFIGELPGQKILIKGNHDYWWSSISKLRSILHPTMHALQNDATVAGEFAICGTRGWLLPSHPKFTTEDEVIYRRECERMKLSLTAAARYELPIVVMTHYPPLSSPVEDTEIAATMRQFGVKVCLYGHLHGSSHRFAVEGAIQGIDYRLVSADYIDFTPIEVSIPQ